jgi:hypothetical protein
MPEALWLLEALRAEDAWPFLLGGVLVLTCEPPPYLRPCLGRHGEALAAVLAAAETN